MFSQQNTAEHSKTGMVLVFTAKTLQNIAGAFKVFTSDTAKHCRTEKFKVFTAKTLQEVAQHMVGNQVSKAVSVLHVWQ